MNSTGSTGGPEATGRYPDTPWGNELAKIAEGARTVVRATFASSTAAFDEDLAIADLMRAIIRFRLVSSPKRPYSRLAKRRVEASLAALHDSLAAALRAAWDVNNLSGPGEVFIDDQPVDIANPAQVRLRSQLREFLADDIFYQVGPGLVETISALTYTVEQFITNTEFVGTPPAAQIPASAPERILFLKTVTGIYERCGGSRFTASDGGRGDGGSSPGVIFVNDCWKLAGQAGHIGASAILSALNK